MSNIASYKNIAVEDARDRILDGVSPETAAIRIAETYSFNEIEANDIVREALTKISIDFNQRRSLEPSIQMSRLERLFNVAVHEMGIEEVDEVGRRKKLNPALIREARGVLRDMLCVVDLSEKFETRRFDRAVSARTTSDGGFESIEKVKRTLERMGINPYEDE